MPKVTIHIIIVYATRSCNISQYGTNVLLCCATRTAPVVLQRQGCTHLPIASVVVVLRQVEAEWTGYDSRLEAMLSIDAAGVVESLLRTATRMPTQPNEYLVMKAQVHSSARTSDFCTILKCVM